MAGQFWLYVLCIYGLVQCMQATYRVKNLQSQNQGYTSAYVLQMMFSLFLNGTEMFQGVECQQCVAAAGTEKIRIFAGALT